VNGLSNFELFGATLATVGDIDADGWLDFVVGAPGGVLFPGSSSVYVFSGMNGQLLFSDTSLSGVAGGDVDGDGTPDLIIGSPGQGSNLAGTAPSGRAFVMSGATGNIVLQAQGSLPIISCVAQIGLGRSVAMLGDVDGDGFAEFAGGAPGENGNLGWVRVFNGQPAIGDSWRQGNVNAQGTGGVVDVFSVDVGLTGNPSTGGSNRSLTFGVGTPFSVWMATPPAGPMVAHHILWGKVAQALVLPEIILPASIGSISLLPEPLSPSDPTVFTLVDAFGFSNQLVLGFPATLSAPGALVATLSAGVPFPVIVSLQGIIRDDSSPNAGLSVTNAIRLVIQ